MIKLNGLSLNYKKCKYCGATHIAGENDDELCFECSFWLSIINNPPDGMEVVGDTCYRILPFQKNPPVGALLGNNGKTFYFMANDLTVKKSNDVWTIGKIPSRFSRKLAPSGYFVNKNIYDKLINDKFNCDAIGCYDRYHCLLYDYRQEFYMDAPFNKIPLDWKVGEEYCPSFINILKIPHFTPIDITDILNP